MLQSIMGVKQRHALQRAAASDRPFAILYVDDPARLKVPEPEQCFHEAAMIDDLYNERILEFAGNISHLGRLEAPDGTASAHSKLCGSTVTVDLKLTEGVVSEFAHEVRACALGQASSSLMARTIVGASADELRALRQTMTRMLKDGGPPPEGRFADMRYLEPVREHKARHASTLLTFDAVEAALDKAEAGKASAAA
jgi:NifU-like protein involved in Fe-S cluster formation